MARVKLSEYDAKRLLFPSQKIFAASLKTKSGDLKKFFGSTPLVVKVDQGVKKRGVQGLVAVSVNAVQVIAKIRAWSDLGYSHFLVEPHLEHEVKDEAYLSLSRSRDGWVVLESNQGGIDIEKNWDSVHSVDPQNYSILIRSLEKYHIATLELNPVIKSGSELIALDAAAEIDDAALGLAELVNLGINPVTAKSQSKSEKDIAVLNESTPASLKFKLIHPDGRIWMLLSGGGASLVLADEVADLGMGSDLANYGEYSGAPSDDDVYAYTKIILKQLLLATSQKPKAIIIAGGVANFTDVAKTFKGLIRALDEKKKELVRAGIKVFVRRGGPSEKKGLAQMESFLKSSGLYGSIHGHDVPLTRVVQEVKEYLS